MWWLASTPLWANEAAANSSPKPLKKRLMRLRQLNAIEAAAGSWKDKDHPELKHGAAEWVDKLRRDDEKRFQKVTAR